MGLMAHPHFVYRAALEQGAVCVRVSCWVMAQSNKTLACHSKSQVLAITT